MNFILPHLLFGHNAKHKYLQVIVQVLYSATEAREYRNTATEIVSNFEIRFVNKNISYGNTYKNKFSSHTGLKCTVHNHKKQHWDLK